MPFVQIAILKGKSPAYARAVADAVNAAVIETMDFPADDRYQVVTEHEPAMLQLQTREGDRVMMSLVMRSGKTDAQKKAFYRTVVERLEADPGIKRENVMIAIAENQNIDWSFRDGLAQFVP